MVVHSWSLFILSEHLLCAFEIGIDIFNICEKTEKTYEHVSNSVKLVTLYHILLNEQVGLHS